MHINPASQVRNNKIGLDAYTTAELEKELDRRRIKELKATSDTRIPAFPSQSHPADLQIAIATQLPDSPPSSQVPTPTSVTKMGPSHSQAKEKTPAEVDLPRLNKPNDSLEESEIPLFLPKAHLPHLQKALSSLSIILPKLKGKITYLLPIYSRQTQNSNVRYSVVLCLRTFIGELKEVIKIEAFMTFEEQCDDEKIIPLPRKHGELQTAVSAMLALADRAANCVERSGNIHWMNDDNFVLLLKQIGDKAEGVEKVVVEVKGALDGLM